MPRETLAPTLRGVVANDGGGMDPDCYTHEDGRRAARELRALLAVARVMEEIHAFCPVFESCSVCRAISRLRRVSAGRARGKGSDR